MGVYPCGVCKDCNNELTFYSFNGLIIGHDKDCPTIKKTLSNIDKRVEK